MAYRQLLTRLTWALALAAVVAPPGRAADPLPAAWSEADIGNPGAPGAAAVDVNGVWSLLGSGAEIEGTGDQFHFHYTSVPGDATITAHFLSMVPGNYPWTKMGPMIRAITPDGVQDPSAQNVTLDITSGVGVWIQGRDDAFPDTQDNIPPVLPLAQPEPLWLRLERMGKNVAGFYSLDGKIWYSGGAVLTLSSLQDAALFGLAITSHWYGNLATGNFDHLSVQTGAQLVSGLACCPVAAGERLTWQPLSTASGYNVYRAPAGTTDPAQYVKINDQPVAGHSFTDSSPGIANHQEYIYLITPLTNGANGQAIEGDRSAIGAGPYVPMPPPGFSITDVNEDPNQQIDYMGGCIPPLGAFYDPSTDTTVIRGAGQNGIGSIFVKADMFGFTSREVTGDFQVSAKMLSLPTRTDPLARAGLMIREGLTADSRFAALLLTASEHGLLLEGRSTAGSYGADASDPVIDPGQLVSPLWLRLTRRGDQITAEYSRDGVAWEGAGDANNQITLQGLAATLSVGLAITSSSPPVPGPAITQASFQDLRIDQ